MTGDNWQEWRRVYAALNKNNRSEVWEAITAQARSYQHNLPKLNFTQYLRLALFSFPAGLAVIQAILSFAMLSILPPADKTPPILLAINYVLSLHLAAWLWWALDRFVRPKVAIV